MPEPSGQVFNASGFRRLIELYDKDQETKIATLSDRDSSAGEDFVESCEFEWLRQGGCGQGQMTLAQRFDYNVLEVGQYVKISYAEGDAWYFGRIESFHKESPSGITVNMYGLLSLLNDFYIGGMHEYDIRKPHLYAASDYYVNDPDRSFQSWDTINSYTQFIHTLYTQYIAPQTGIRLGEIESPDEPVDFTSMVFRGEESLAEVIRAAAAAQFGASWGVNADREFFFVQKTDDVIGIYKEDDNITQLTENNDRTLMYNRIILTGGYVYGTKGAAGFYRYRAPWQDADSVALYGPKQVELYVPWIRNDLEAKRWVDGFFTDYSGPRKTYSVTTIPQRVKLLPWEGKVRVLDRHGSQLAEDIFDSVKVEFNEAPIFSFRTGVEDLQYPVTPEPQRWEQPEDKGDNGNIDPPSEDVPSFSGLSFTLSLTGSNETQETDEDPTEQTFDPSFSLPPKSSGGHGTDDTDTFLSPSSGTDDTFSLPPKSSGGASSSGGDTDGSGSGSGGGSSSGGDTDGSGSGSSSGGSGLSGSSGLSGESGSSGDSGTSGASSSGGESDGDSSGSGKDTAVVPASWSPGGYTALFVTESPEVRFEDILIVATSQVDCIAVIDPKFVEVCEIDSIEISGWSCNRAMSGTPGFSVAGDRITIEFAEQRPEKSLRLVLETKAIRRGFAGVRFPDRTAADFVANEAWIKRGTPDCPPSTWDTVYDRGVPQGGGQ